uniref:Uncharacterized protein n=1 Tax=Attheya septentrionalis TaxID=420275 RepID=A0A7S2UEH1_9STRA|mmetsp:Transcript_21624/g.39112  ORF Transcript_21624/g.39112 Transcript_21624/m.39112 type:complete len:410 (+) Transcript_21624:68-1297(+)
MDNSRALEGIGGPVQLDTTDFGGIDPALEDCCRRDAEDTRRKDALTTTLRRHDRVALAERRRRIGRHLLPDLSFGAGCRCCYDPNGDGGEYPALVDARSSNFVTNSLTEKTDLERENQAHHQPEESDKNDSDDDSEFDYLLDEDLPGSGEGGEANKGDSLLQQLEDDRRAELELAMLHRESAMQHGYGVHRQFAPARVFRAADLMVSQGRGAAAPAVVLHLYETNSMLSASLDLFLEELAMDFGGTKFMRADGRSTIILESDVADKVFPKKVRPSDDLPALVAIRDGVVVAFCPSLNGLADRSSQRIEPRAVQEWLDRAGVLRTELPRIDDLCRIRPEEDALYESMLALSAVGQQIPFQGKNELQGDDDVNIYNCGVPGCNKAFSHEHVGIKTNQQDGLVVSEEQAIGN